jgi:hypothetical protein
MNGGLLRLTLSAGWLVILFAGCTTRKAAEPPPPSYPAVPASSVQVLDRRPNSPYEAIGTITVQTGAEISRDRTISEIRQKAGNGGANIIVVLSEKVFTWRNPTTRQRLRTRRIVVQAIRSFSSRAGGTRMTSLPLAWFDSY